jgi:hypothetical protein
MKTHHLRPQLSTLADALRIIDGRADGDMGPLGLETDGSGSLEQFSDENVFF